MNVFESFRVALMALRTNKLRALLTMLGIIIGVGAVVGMLSIGNGLSNYFAQEFDKLGIGVFYISPSIDSSDANNTQRPQLTFSDIEAIMVPGAVPAAEAVAVQYNSNAVVGGGGELYYYSVNGVTPSQFMISKNDLGFGRFYTEEEERNSARVALIGQNVAKTLFGDAQAAVGRRLTLNGVNFEVVGVLATKASAMAMNDPAENIYIPYHTARNRLFRNQIDSRVDISQATIKAVGREQVETAIQQVTVLLRERHRLTYQSNDFRVQNPKQQAQQFEAVMLGFNAFLGAIAGISLLVGGIGIMNIMLVSVTQRTREIGLRKAVGARRRDILLQFLIESIVLCLVGGLIGVLLGFALSSLGTFVLVVVMKVNGAQAMVSLDSIVMATVVAMSIGIFFGLYPAVRAARLDPIRALRHE